MGIFSKLFKKREQPESSDTFNVILKTNKKLSEEQKSTIITIVKDGAMSRVANRDIAIQIMMSTGIQDIVILNRIGNSVMEVIL